MQCQRGLAILVGGEVLRHGGWNGLVARHDALDQTTHGFNAERQRNHVQQQQIRAGVVAGQLIGGNSSTQGDDLIGVQVGQRFTAKKAGNGLAHLRHAGGAAHQHHAVNRFLAQLGVPQGLAHGGQGALGQVGGGSLEVGRFHFEGDRGFGQATRERHDFRHRQRFFAGAGGAVQGGFVGWGECFNRQPGLGQDPVHQRAVVVVTAQGGIPASGHDFKHALAQAQDGNVKGAAAQVVNGKYALAGIVQAVGNGRGRGFVDEAEHVEAGQLRGVFGGLALGIVEVGGHGDDGTVDLVVKSVFSPKTQRGQDFSADFNRAFFTGNGLQRDHAGLVIELVRHVVAVTDVDDVVKAAPHQPLDRGNGVARVVDLGGQGFKADLAALRVEVTHHAGQNHAAFAVGQAFSHAAAHAGNQRVGGSQVNADGDAPLVRVWRLAGFRYLKKCHVICNRSRLIVPVGPCAHRPHWQIAR